MTYVISCSRREMNREIIRMTIPTVLGNIMVPLLALCDTAVAGHMPGEVYLAGVALGSMMMTAAYWLFSFLRAGTSGIAAGAYGASDRREMSCALLRSLALGVLLGLLIMMLKAPLCGLMLKAMGASDEVSLLAERYFSVCVYGAVPMMLITAVSGWLVGMQSTSMAMAVNVSLSVLNVAVTLALVYIFDFGFSGIPLGTMFSQWLILVPAAFIVAGICRRFGLRLVCSRREFFNSAAWRKMFGVNSNLFFRSACLIMVSMIVYAYGARLGDVAVGANAVINQLFLFFSYFMDGFAFTGEALVGRFVGERSRKSASLAICQLLKWTALMAAVFMVVYALGLHAIVSALCDSEAVAAVVENCMVWVVILPLAGAAAFIFDGFYVGLTHTRPMLLSTLAGVAVFIALLAFARHTQWILWMSFTCYLVVRSLILIAIFPKTMSGVPGFSRLNYNTDLK